MPEVSWRLLMREHPAPHLVAGIMPAAADEPADAACHKLRLALLARLARSLRLHGLYALAAIPERSGNAIQCALARRDDAERLGAAVGAAATGDLPGFASQRSFRFDAAAAEAIARSLRQRGPGRTPIRNRSAAIL